MSEISVGIPLRCDSFIDLNDLHVLPGNIFFCEIAKHDPGGFAPAHGHPKSAASSNRISCLFGDELRSCQCDGVGIGMDFNVHHAASLATLNVFFSLGLLQPPVGVTRSTSFGPQLPGAY